MRKYLILMLVSIFLVSGCSISKVEDTGVLDTLKTILYKENNLKNTFMEGYEFYLPKGVKIIDKSDFNLKIKDNKNVYYLYIDTIAYHYHIINNFIEKNNHFYSKAINYNGKTGYIDIIENSNSYFVVLMYNYAKIESYVLKSDFSSSFINMCYILSTIKYNDNVISEYVGKKGVIYQEEKFNIFNSEEGKDNFLKYEEEYGMYNEKIDINKDNDIIDINDIVE